MYKIKKKRKSGGEPCGEPVLQTRVLKLITLTKKCCVLSFKKIDTRLKSSSLWCAVHYKALGLVVCKQLKSDNVFFELHFENI